MQYGHFGISEWNNFGQEGVLLNVKADIEPDLVPFNWEGLPSLMSSEKSLKTLTQKDAFKIFFSFYTSIF